MSHVTNFRADSFTDEHGMFCGDTCKVSTEPHVVLMSTGDSFLWPQQLCPQVIVYREDGIVERA